MRRIITYIPALVCTVAIPLLSLLNPGELPDTKVLHFAGMDKVLHFIVYAGLTCAWALPIPAAKRSNILIMSCIALSAGFYGAVMELCQLLFTTCRHMDFFDAAANLAGAFSAALVVYYFGRRVIISQRDITVTETDTTCFK